MNANNWPINSDSDVLKLGKLSVVFINFVRHEMTQIKPNRGYFPKTEPNRNVFFPEIQTKPKLKNAFHTPLGQICCSYKLRYWQTTVLLTEWRCSLANVTVHCSTALTVWQTTVLLTEWRCSLTNVTVHCSTALTDYFVVDRMTLRPSHDDVG